MIRLDARIFARGSSAVLATAVMACSSGCTGRVYAGPANVEAQPLVVGPVEEDSDVAYVQDPPVNDIESYPTVFYGGVQVYYVGGYWYHRGPRGWAYYRQEPAELGRQRQEHWQRDHESAMGRPARGAASRSGGARRLEAGAATSWCDGGATAGPQGTARTASAAASRRNGAGASSASERATTSQGAASAAVCPEARASRAAGPPQRAGSAGRAPLIDGGGEPTLWNGHRQATPLSRHTHRPPSCPPASSQEQPIPPPPSQLRQYATL